MTRWMMLLCLACAIVVPAGCATRGQVTEINTHVGKLSARVDADEKQAADRSARIEALEKQQALLAGRLDALEKLAGAMDVRLIAIEKLSIDLDARIKNAEKLSSEAAKQEQATAAELEAVKVEVKQVAGIATKSHELFIKSMENLRELYKRQYDAIDEILNRAGPVATPPAAPK